MGERQNAGHAEAWERYMEVERQDRKIRRVPDSKGHAVRPETLRADDRNE